jgi:hypothetical protein
MLNTLCRHPEWTPVEPEQIDAKPRDDRDDALFLHQCPTCGRLHRVNAVRNRLAYGRQLTCSTECESKKRKLWRLRWRRIHNL